MTQHPIAAFLLARYDEAEADARAATPGPWRHDPDKHWRKPGTTWFEEAVFAGPPGDAATCIAGTGESDDPQSMADAAHIAAHDPVSVLADIGAKRLIVAEHQLVPAAAPGPGEPAYGCETCHDHSEYGVGAFGPCTTLKLLALPFAQHPDYQETWKP